MDDDAQEIIYQIGVRGSFDRRFEGWFFGMQINTELDETGNPITVFTGPVVDQIALRDLMTKLWDLNLELISINRTGVLADDTGGCPDETDD